MTTDLARATMQQAEYEELLKTRVIEALRNSHGSATRCQLIKALGFTPEFEKLVEQKVIRLSAPGQNPHYELVM